MGYRRFNLVVLISLIAACSLCAAINYVVDPNGIFGRDPARQRDQPNVEFVKMRHLLAHSAHYDSLVVGSSRVGKINVRRLGNGRYYNLCYALGVPGAYLNDIKVLLANGMIIKNILMGLDDFSYKVNPAEYRHHPARHPYGTWMENARFFVEYLLVYPNKKAISEYFGSGIRKNTIFIDMYDTGMLFWGEEDEKIEKDRTKHINDPEFNKPCYYDGDRLSDAIAEIREIKDICNRNNINLSVFINPIHKTTYINADLPRFQEFKNQLVEFMEFYDFSGLNSITVDNYCYYETSHYRSLVGDFIVSKIFDDNDGRVPEDFGVLVSKSNIETHLESMRRSLEDKSIIPYSEQTQPDTRQTFGHSR